MRIKKLELRDYKCFEELVLDNLGNRVVLVGPNGCGKSAVLEAIAALKETVATYDPNRGLYARHLPVLNVHTTCWPAEVPLPIRGDRPSATVAVDVELEPAEAALCNDVRTASVSILIERSGKVTPTSKPDISKLFANFDPNSGAGVIDYISPHRVFPLQRVKAISMDAISVDQQRKERIELQRPNFDYGKFRAIKQFIISEQLEDLSYQQTSGQLRDSLLLLKQLFTDFFGPKALRGYRRSGNEMQVSVLTPYGEHDIDQLSSGERELFYVLVNLFRIRALPSVILYDEPERHLNPGLEAKLIPALERLQTKNQLWIATHGVELIGTVPMQEIVALRRDAGTSKPERFTDESMSKRVELFQQLGAKTGLQFAGNRIVFLEGEDSHKDKAILDKLVGPRLPGVVFVASGPSAGVLGAGTRAGLVLQEASKDARFLMVLDRDYRESNSIACLKKRLNDRVFVWSCHELENVLLIPSSILQVLNANGADQLKTPDDVKRALRKAAEDQTEVFVHQWAAYRLCAGYSVDVHDDPAAPRDCESFRKFVESRQRYATNAFSTSRVSEVEEEARKGLANCLASDDWLSVLPGKEILCRFRTEHIPQLNQALFINQIVSRVAEQHHQCDELDKLVSFIQAV